MARTMCRLTTNKIRNAKPGPDGRTIVMCDGGGLWLQVSSCKDGQASKSWFFRYATPDMKVSATGRAYRFERQMGLGPLHTVGLAEAREMARQARLLILQGKDPLAERDVSRGAAAAARTKGKIVTFEAAMEGYLRKVEDTWTNRVHRTQWRKSMHDYVLPALGKLDVKAISDDDVLAVLRPIWSSRHETASRIRGRIENVLNFAGRSTSNPARWEGLLEFKLAKRNKLQDPIKHLKALPYAEIGQFMAELRAKSSIAARALEFCVLTATRTDEIVGATWSELDLQARTWRIPIERLKRRGEEKDGSHTIPLSDAALAVLKFMAEIRQDDRIFSIGPQAMLLCLRELRQAETVHGFRSTFRSWAGGCTVYPRDVCEMALGHAVGSAVERSYMRDALLAKRRVLMNDWAEFCSKPLADIVRMRRQEDASNNQAIPA